MEKKYSLKNLNQEYREVYQQTQLFLQRDIEQKSERKAVLRELFEFLLDAQQKNTPVKELFPEGYEAFYQDLICGLSTYPAPRKRKQILRIRALALSLFVLCTSVIIGQYLTTQGYIGIWTQGIGYIATDFNNYNYQATTVKENVSFDIDFSRWESYRDVVVYRNGDITIKLECLDHYDGRYRIFFRAHGIYSRDGATIVSWRKYSVDETHKAAWTQTAELYCYDADENYNCKLAGYDYMHKDKDSFGFHVPSSVTDTDVVTFQFVNLTLSRWERRSTIPVSGC